MQHICDLAAATEITNRKIYGKSTNVWKLNFGNYIVHYQITWDQEIGLKRDNFFFLLNENEAKIYGMRGE